MTDDLTPPHWGYERHEVEEQNAASRVPPERVKALVDSGLDTKTVAEALGVSRGTVQRKIRIAEGRAGRFDRHGGPNYPKPIQYAQREPKGEPLRAEEPPCPSCGVRSVHHAEHGCGRRL